MQHKVKVTVIDKKVYPELQAQYCADREAGACPCYHVGDEFIFERYGAADDFWHMGLNTLRKTAHVSGATAGGEAFPHCSEAWDAISRYIYAGLQGGSLMRGWMQDERVMIACCSDGTRPVIFKLERLDYKVLYLDGMAEADQERVRAALTAIDGVSQVAFPGEAMAEVFLQRDVADGVLQEAIERCGYAAKKID